MPGKSCERQSRRKTKDVTEVAKATTAKLQIWKNELKLLLIKENVWTTVEGEEPENKTSEWFKLNGKALFNRLIC